MVLAKDPLYTSVFYFEAEAFDRGLMESSNFVMSKSLHVNHGLSLYQSTGQCVYFSVLN